MEGCCQGNGKVTRLFGGGRVYYTKKGRSRGKTPTIISGVNMKGPGTLIKRGTSTGKKKKRRFGDIGATISPIKQTQKKIRGMEERKPGVTSWAALLKADRTKVISRYSSCRGAPLHV